MLKHAHTSRTMDQVRGVSRNSDWVTFFLSVYQQPPIKVLMLLFDRSCTITKRQFAELPYQYLRVGGKLRPLLLSGRLRLSTASSDIAKGLEFSFHLVLYVLIGYISTSIC